MKRGGARPSWLGVAEVGSVWGIRFVVGLCAHFGRAPARAFLRVLVAYYCVFHGPARRASRAYLRRVFGRVTMWMVYRHLCTFADVALDRWLFAAGKFAPFRFTRSGSEHLLRLQHTRQGALLLGAHLGSFEGMRAGAVTEQLPVRMVANFQNAQRMQAVIDALDPEASARVISVAEGGLDFVLAIRASVERGELVAILADRVSNAGITAEAPFLGEHARFAAGPFLVAAALRCPIYLTFCLYRGGNRYDLYCEPFVEQLVLPRAKRAEALDEVVQRYAQRLEHYVRLAPYNWFNFYDFWGKS